MIKGLGIFILGRLGFDSVTVVASLRVSSRSSSLYSDTLAPALELTKDVLMLFHLGGHKKLVSPFLRLVKLSRTCVPVTHFESEVLPAQPSVQTTPWLYRNAGELASSVSWD